MVNNDHKYRKKWVLLGFEAGWSSVKQCTAVRYKIGAGLAQ